VFYNGVMTQLQEKLQQQGYKITVGHKVRISKDGKEISLTTNEFFNMPLRAWWFVAERLSNSVKV
jgi:L-2-hydroxyglutarate oxidase LhgO